MQENNIYSDYSEVDFAGDEFFQEWVLHPTASNDQFWKDFLMNHPQKAKAIENARVLLLSVKFKEEWPSDAIVEQSLKSTFEVIKSGTKKHSKVIPFARWWAAAAILIALASTAYFLVNQNGTDSVSEIASQFSAQDVKPGGNRAVLTLADGSTIILDSVQNGLLSTQGSAQVVKLQNGNIVYQIEKGKEQKQLAYNTISTPRGGQYQLQLSDGSKVWLNAASSITFPSSFPGKDREVTITGEAYFEVAHDPGKPFHVIVDNMEVNVLGTHFNINAYGDNGDIKTTLLQGSVGVKYDHASVIIKPGEQVSAKEEGHTLKVIKGVDLDEVVAWKNGFFSFRHSCIRDITRQLSRWYNIDVEYDDDIRNQEFTGKIDRSLSLDEVLKILEKTGVRYRIEGHRKLIILP